MRGWILIKQLLIASLPAVGALGGVWLTSKYNYDGIKLSSQLTATSACIARLDAREDKLKENSDKFISTLAKLISYSSFNSLNNKGELEKLVSPVIERSFMLVSYAPESLSSKAQLIAARVQGFSKAEINHDSVSSDKEIAEITRLSASWSTTFNETLSSFEVERRKCKN